MSKQAPSTAATAFLISHGVDYSVHLYDYVEKGGTRVSSQALGVDEHSVVKTLMMQTETGDALVVLMHGDCKVDTKKLASILGCRKVVACPPARADELSGFIVGGTSPFGLRTALPVFLQESVLAISKIYINGGERGFLVGIQPTEIVRILAPRMVDVAVLTTNF